MKPVKQRRTWVIILTVGLLCLGLLASSSMAATVTVTNTNNSGTGSLRQAITDAGSGDTIVFALTYPATITLSATLTINKNISIWGPGRDYLTISGNNAVRVFDCTSGTIAIRCLSVANGRVAGGTQNGAGFRLGATADVLIENCNVMNHYLTGTSLNYGAAFYTPSGATLQVYHSNIYNNTLTVNSTCEGAAFYTEGDVTIVGCRISNNTARLGPALMNRGDNTKTVTIYNSTITKNTSTADGVIDNQLNGILVLNNCTVTQNVSGQFEAGLFANAGTVILRNTVIAGNLPSNGMGDTDIYFMAGVTLLSSDYNIIGSTGSQTYSWSTHDQVGTEASPIDPNLGALADNGGYSQTHAPNAGSPVLNPASSNSASFVDQRGYLRNGTADIGACEYGGTLPVATSATGAGSTDFTANWNTVSGATAYWLDVATDTNFTSMVSGYWNLNVGSVTSYGVSGLSEGTTYYYRLRATDGTFFTYYTNTVAVTTIGSSPTATPSVTPTVTTTATSSITATTTPTFTSTATPTITDTATATRSITITSTPTATVTGSLTHTATFTVTGTVTPTATESPTATVSATQTQTSTHSPTGTETIVVTATPTATVSPTFTPTPTVTSTRVVGETATATATYAPAPGGVLAYPNPARGQVKFLVSLDQAETIRIRLYNLSGERIAVLEQAAGAGTGCLVWNCTDVAPGVYLATVTAGKISEKIKIAVVK